jgi:hypothetical protein
MMITEESGVNKKVTESQRKRSKHNHVQEKEEE